MTVTEISWPLCVMWPWLSRWHECHHVTVTDRHEFDTFYRSMTVMQKKKHHDTVTWQLFQKLYLSLRIEVLTIIYVHFYIIGFYSHLSRNLVNVFEKSIIFWKIIYIFHFRVTFNSIFVQFYKKYITIIKQTAIHY